MKYYPVSLKRLKRETPEAVTITFDIPDNVEEAFNFKAGQYVSVRTRIAGQLQSRVYSISSSPLDPHVSITVKKIENGLFSSYINDTLKLTDTLEIGLPLGNFVLDQPKKAASYFAIAAGSGITPIMSMIKYVMASEPSSRFVLLYGNKSPEHTIFLKELEELAENYPSRLFLEYQYSQADIEGTHRGRINEQVLNNMLNDKYKDFQFDNYYLCGPEELKNTVSDTLLKNRVQKEKILHELFFTNVTSNPAPGNGNKSTAKVTIKGKNIQTCLVNQENTLLDELLQHKIDIPHSCKSGLCKSCISRVTNGQISSEENFILSDEEIANNLVLLCMAKPVSSNLEIDILETV